MATKPKSAVMDGNPLLMIFLRIAGHQTVIRKALPTKLLRPKLRDFFSEPASRSTISTRPNSFALYQGWLHRAGKVRFGKFHIERPSRTAGQGRRTFTA